MQILLFILNFQYVKVYIQLRFYELVLYNCRQLLSIFGSPLAQRTSDYPGARRGRIDITPKIWMGRSPEYKNLV